MGGGRLDRRPSRAARPGISSLLLAAPASITISHFIRGVGGQGPLSSEAVGGGLLGLSLGLAALLAAAIVALFFVVRARCAEKAARAGPAVERDRHSGLRKSSLGHEPSDGTADSDAGTGTSRGELSLSRGSPSASSLALSPPPPVRPQPEPLSNIYRSNFAHTLKETRDSEAAAAVVTVIMHKMRPRH